MTSDLLEDSSLISYIKTSLCVSFPLALAGVRDDVELLPVLAGLLGNSKKKPMSELRVMTL